MEITIVQVVKDVDKKSFVEFKTVRKLLHHLPDTIHPNSTIRKTIDKVRKLERKIRKEARNARSARNSRSEET